MAIDVISAIIDELATHLKANISGLQQVMRSFPDPNRKIQYPSISLTTARPIARLNYPEFEKKIAVGDGIYTVYYRIGKIDVPIQLDIWAMSASQRGQYQNSVINTLMTQVSTWGDDYAEYTNSSRLILPMTNYFDTKCGYMLRGFEWQDTEDSAARREFRALVNIDAESNILITRTQTAIETMDINWKVGTQDLVDLANLTAETQIIF